MVGGGGGTEPASALFWELDGAAFFLVALGLGAGAGTGAGEGEGGITALVVLRVERVAVVVVEGVARVLGAGVTVGALRAADAPGMADGR